MTVTTDLAKYYEHTKKMCDLTNTPMEGAVSNSLYNIFMNAIKGSAGGTRVRHDVTHESAILGVCKDGSFVEYQGDRDLCKGIMKQSTRRNSHYVDM